MKRILVSLIIVIVSSVQLLAQTRWNIEPDGSIKWTVGKGDLQSDNIEMSRKRPVLPCCNRGNIWYKADVIRFIFNPSTIAFRME